MRWLFFVGVVGCVHGVYKDPPKDNTIDYRLPEQVHLALGGKNEHSISMLANFQQKK